MHALPGLTLVLSLLPAAAVIIPVSASSNAVEPAATPKRGRPTIAFGDRGELIVDGRRRFIRGGYRSGQVDGFTDALRSAADAGFDLVHDYRFDGFDIGKRGVKEYVAEARAYLRRADSLGLGVFLGLPRESVSAADEATLTAIVEALAEEHALWLWYIYDEPSPSELSPRNAERVHRLLRRLDPGRPSVMLANKPDVTQQYMPFCDLLWRNSYPIAATSPEKSSLQPLAQALDTTMKAVNRQKPVWSVLQAQDNKGSPKLRKRVANLPRPDDRNHRPNESELRAAAHVAIASGSMAAIYYWAPENWYSMKTDTPGIWDSLGKVLQELGRLEPALLAPPAPRPLQMIASDARVMTWTRVHEGEVYVGLVNTDINAPTQVRFQSPDASGPFRKVTGDGSLERADSGASVRLGPAGVLVIAATAR